MTFDMNEYQIESVGVRYLLPVIHLSTQILRKQLLAYFNVYFMKTCFYPSRYQIDHLFRDLQEYNYYAWDIVKGSWIHVHIAQRRLEDLFVVISESLENCFTLLIAEVVLGVIRCSFQQFPPLSISSSHFTLQFAIIYSMSSAIFVMQTLYYLLPTTPCNTLLSYPSILHALSFDW